MNEVFADIFETLGPGHTESVYHRALEVSLRLGGIPYESEVVVPILFRGYTVGNIRCDVIIGDTVIELKAVSRLNEDHRQQLRNYLMILDKPRGLLVNFGSTLTVEEIKRPTESDHEVLPEESHGPL